MSAEHHGLAVSRDTAGSVPGKRGDGRRSNGLVDAMKALPDVLTAGYPRPGRRATNAAALTVRPCAARSVARTPSPDTLLPRHRSPADDA